jgi:nicotinate-nucleotide adenylyltransferase
MPRPGPLGVFGGTFDPIHFGHLRLAQEALDALALAGIVWLPAGQPPHREVPLVGARQRLDMVRLATADNPAFSVDAAEVEASAPSYTVHTLERLRALHDGDRPLVLLLGADAFAGLASWHRWPELFELAHLAIAERPGCPLLTATLPEELASAWRLRLQRDPVALSRHPAGSIVRFPMTQLAVSATHIRALLAAGATPRYLLPDSVLDYIRTHHLYQPPSQPT